MHPRLSVNSLCLPGTTLQAELDAVAGMGAGQVALLAAKVSAEGWEAGIAKVRASGLRVAALVHPLLPRAEVLGHGNRARARAELDRTIEAAAQLGTDAIYIPSGARSGASFEEAAEAFAQAIAPCNVAAKAAGISLLVENASAFHVDFGLTSTLRDTLRLAEMADVGVCIDLFGCWTEGDLEATVRATARRCGLVQVSDYVLGDRSLPCRAVPGDGVIPIARMIGWIIESGYAGAFDLELLGPRIDAEGHEAAVARAATVVGAMLPADPGTPVP